MAAKNGPNRIERRASLWLGGICAQQKPGCPRHVVASKGVMQMTEWNPTHAHIPKLAQAKGTNSLNVCTAVALDGSVGPLEHCFHNTNTHCFLHYRGSLLSLQSNYTTSHLCPPATLHTYHPPQLSPSTATTLHTNHPPHYHPPQLPPSTLPPSTLTTLHTTTLHTTTFHTYHPPQLPPSTLPPSTLTPSTLPPSTLTPSTPSHKLHHSRSPDCHCERLAQARQLVLVGGGMLQAPLTSH